MVDFAKLLRDGPPPPPIVPRLVIGVTGHRPHKLPDAATGYDRNNPTRTWLRGEIKAATQRLIAALPTAPDRFRATHLDSYLRQVQWRGERPGADAVVGVTGGALGIDQDTAGVWARMSVPYIVAVPFPGQESRWPRLSREIYAAVLAHAAGIVTVSPVPPRDDAEAAKMLHARNEWMCCASDEMIAVWNGSRGGTSHCVRFFQIGGKRVVRIDPNDMPT